MSLFEPAPQPWPDRMLAIFRVVAGLIFITSGTTKPFGFPPSPDAGIIARSKRSPSVPS